MRQLIARILNVRTRGGHRLRVGVFSSPWWPRSVLLTLTAAAATPAVSATLPVPCLAGSCGTKAPGFVTSGAATAQQSGKQLTVNQTSNSAILNWASFDISADGKVVFNQPSATSLALNQIWQQNPSTILGSISANGSIYLVNPNGFVFGAGSTINVGSLLASSLSLSPTAISKGILSPDLLSGGNPIPALDGGTQRYVTDNQGNIVNGPDGKPMPVQIVVQPGAQMTAADQGRIMLAAQSVQNGGTLTAPDGQVVLAAGQQVYLQASSDPKLRGLIVEVDSNPENTSPNANTAWNQLTGVLSAPRGNIYMTGLMVNQDGRTSATTAVSANGSVTLVAADRAVAPNINGVPVLQASAGGTLELGPQSSIDIAPELSSTATEPVAQAQLPSTVTLSGQQIVMHSGASIVAPGGTVTATAETNPSLGIVDPNSNAQLRIDSGVDIDVSGSTADLPVSANIVLAQLNAAQLENDPQNANGFLHGQTVYVDTRVGTSVADVSSNIAAVAYNVAYRTTAGGTVSLQSEGDVVLNKGATINVSGGQINYAGGVVATTQLIASNGQTYDIGKAPADLTYVGLVNPTYTTTYNGWGVTTTQSTPGTGKYQPGYTQGAPAGTVQVAGTNIVLNGTLLGNAYNGPYQRTPATLNPGGQLIIGMPAGNPNTSSLGTDYVAPAVQFVADAPPFAIADGTPFPGQQTLDLPVAYLTQGGFTRTDIFSNQSITLPAGLPLSLPAGSTFTLGAPRIDIDSSITSAGGTLQFFTADTIYDLAGQDPTSQGIDIGTGVVLDVRGQWTNDLLIAQGGSQPAGQIAQNGGTITLSLDGGSIANPIAGSTATTLTLTGGTAGQLTLGAGSALEASGGAWLAANGTLTGGTGGAISLVAGGTQDALSIGNAVSLDAFGAQTAAGGQFSLSTNRIEISQGSGWSDAQSVDALKPGVLQLSSGLFTQYGFSAVDLAATGPAASGTATSPVLIVNPRTSIQAQESNLMLGKQYATTRSSGSIMGFSQVEVLPDYARPAESVSLTYGVAPGIPTSSTPPNAGEILIGLGADISVDPTARITLASVGSIDIEGTLRAPAGAINVSTTGIASGETTLPGEGILVGSNAVLDAGGASIYKPNNGNGFYLGSVYGGGSVSLTANYGDVTVDSGSQINVAGIGAPLDVVGSSGAYGVQTVNTAGGSVSVSSVGKISLDGSIDAAAGSNAATRAAGGSLTIALLPAPIDVTDTRTIEIGASSAPTSIDTDVTFLSAPALAATGAANLTLRVGYAPPYQAGGVIQVDPGVSLAMGESLTLDAPTIAMTGGPATLKAPSVTFTNSGAVATAGATAGTGTLNVNGDFIDLVGTQVFQGIGKAIFTSTGDVRLDGLNNSGGTQQYAGSLTVGGDLTINAARVYPSTATQFTLASTAAKGSITIGQTAGSPGEPLSVGGSLTITADQVTNAGSVYAPFGEINLNAGTSLTLAAGSITSVSGAGLIIPYGTTTDGNWTYGANPVDNLPPRQVSLTAPSVSIANSATVDLTGGGDLYAYEFEPGTGGTNNVLANLVSNGGIAGLYAILPQLKGQYAPYDPQAFAGSSLCAGSAACSGGSVYLSGIAGLPAGVYPLLPASYALLPGAYLIQAVPNSQGTIAPGVTHTLTTGATEIAGYMTFGNTGLGDALYSGFAIYPGSYSRTLATYQDTYASTYFPQVTAAAGLAAPNLPADAGTLLMNIQAPQSASMIQGQILSQAATGGAGADIEITAPSLEVTSGTSAAGSVGLSAAVLDSWNAGQLLLGGVRSSANSHCGSSICVVSDKVTVDSGVTLAATDVELVAGTNIDVSGTVASTSGLNAAAAPKTLPTATPVTLASLGEAANSNDSTAALLVVSDTQLAVTSRTNSGTTGGTITLESSGSLKSAGAIAAEGPGGITLGGSVSAAGASVSLATGTIQFDSSAPAAGTTVNPGMLTISSALLNTLQQSQALRLTASNSIDVLTDTTLGATGPGATPSLGSLTLVTNEIDATPGVNVTFGAKSLTLGGTADPTATATGGTANLTLVANTLNVSPGTTAPGVLVFNGFGQTTAQVSGAVLGSGSSGLLFGGDATVTAAAIAGTDPTTAINGASLAPEAPNLTLAANGNLGLASSGSIPSGLSVALGTQVTLSGQSIDDQASIVVPSGNAILNATNSLSIGPNALIDASGRAVTITGQTTSSPGGAISLTSGGALTVASGAVLAVGGGPNADAGSLSINGAGTVTLGGSMTGAATGGARGGSFSLQAGQLAGTFDTLADAIQAGGFSYAQGYRVNNGDLTLDAGHNITANQVELVADTGNIQVGGTISAPSSDLRGSIDLFAGQNVHLLASGELLANSSGVRGGDVEIGTTQGRITLDAGSTVSATGTQQLGTLTLRAPAVGNDVAIDSLSGVKLAGLSQVMVDPVLTSVLSTDPTSTTYLDSSTMAGIETSAATYMNNAQGVITTRLAAPGSTQLIITPAVELDTAGSVVGNDSLDLTSWRFGSNNTPVDLTVRAGGAVQLTGSITDGQTAGNNGVRNSIDVLSGQSSSITVVAGADLASASPTATISPDSSAGATADLTLGQGVILTTGTGNITLAAAHDVVFGQGATVYTTGSSATPSQAIESNRASLTAATGGGNVSIRAGQDIDGSPVTASISDWMTRTVTVSKTDGSTAVQWGVDLSAFNNAAYNVATLGGGDLSLSAGGSMSAISAASADSRTVTNGQVTLNQGGGLVVHAGQDVDSDSQFYLADGTGKISAGGSIGTTRPVGQATQVGILLGQVNSQLSVSARGDVLLTGDINPTGVIQPSVPTKSASQFYSYGDSAALNVTSVGGTLTFDNDDTGSLGVLLNATDATNIGANNLVLPGSFSAAALSGDLVVTNAVTLAPSPVGQLSLFAGRNFTNCVLNCSGNGEVQVTMSDDPAGKIPTIDDPTVQFAASNFAAPGAIHVGDDQPVRVAAGGDVDGMWFTLPKAAQVTAGKDIINLYYVGQNVAAADTTLISAGRDISDTSDFNGSISLGGPGALDLFAGRNINLSTSQGISTTGSLSDPNLPSAAGASINVWAGLGVPADVGGFVKAIVAPSTTLQQSLVAFMDQQTGSSSLTYSQAQSDFLALPFVDQQPFVANTFFGQLLASGLAASTSNAGYAQGYAAIDALFPGSRIPPNTTNPYQGDLQLPFSSIYSLQGGSISILVPGGLVNVGDVSPPTGAQARPASSLGIVAQSSGDVRIYTSGDVDVNSSRIFALDGGNIQIWSDEGSIDAGRGSKTAISAPPPRVTIDPNGNVTLDFSGSVAGSGIRTVVTSPDGTPGNVYLTAPVGTVDAGDAGIVSAGAIYVSAAHVIVGSGGFSAAGAEVGVPPAVSGLGAALSGASSAASSSTNVTNNSVAESAATKDAAAPVAQATLSWLDVFVEGFGNENCKPEDAECLKRSAAH